jgi:GT2 family glycosyltransferase
MHIFKIPDAQSKIAEYKRRFDRKASPYILPSINYEWSFTTQELKLDKAEIYVAIPVKNQEEGIFSILESLCESIDSYFSMGLVLDNCTDKTFQEVCKFLSLVGKNVANLARVDVLTSGGDLFEATCENLLFELCKEPFFMSLQADIFLADKSFVTRSLRAFHQNQELAGISGRARVSFHKNPEMAQPRIIRSIVSMGNYVAPKIFRWRKLGWHPKRTGYFGDISDYPKSRMRFTRRNLLTIYTGEAIIRGPLIWRSETFRKLAGYNDVSYFLGRDDCDLSLRARLSYGMFVAYLPSRSYSYSHAGTTRKERDSKAIAELLAREELSRLHPGRLHDYWNGQVQTPPTQFVSIRIK